MFKKNDLINILLVSGLFLIFFGQRTMAAGDVDYQRFLIARQEIVKLVHGKTEAELAKSPLALRVFSSYQRAYQRFTKLEVDIQGFSQNTYVQETDFYNRLRASHDSISRGKFSSMDKELARNAIQDAEKFFSSSTGEPEYLIQSIQQGNNLSAEVVQNLFETYFSLETIAFEPIVSSSKYYKDAAKIMSMAVESGTVNQELSGHYTACKNVYREFRSIMDELVADPPRVPREEVFSRFRELYLSFRKYQSLSAGPSLEYYQEEYKTISLKFEAVRGIIEEISVDSSLPDYADSDFDSENSEQVGSLSNQTVSSKSFQASSSDRSFDSKRTSSGRSAKVQAVVSTDASAADDSGLSARRKTRSSSSSSDSRTSLRSRTELRRESRAGSVESTAPTAPVAPVAPVESVTKPEPEIDNSDYFREEVVMPAYQDSDIIVPSTMDDFDSFLDSLDDFLVTEGEEDFHDAYSYYLSGDMVEDYDYDSIPTGGFDEDTGRILVPAEPDSQEEIFKATDQEQTKTFRVYSGERNFSELSEPEILKLFNYEFEAARSGEFGQDLFKLLGLLEKKLKYSGKLNEFESLGNHSLAAEFLKIYPQGKLFEYYERAIVSFDFSSDEFSMDILNLLPCVPVGRKGKQMIVYWDSEASLIERGLKIIESGKFSEFTPIFRLAVSEDPQAAVALKYLKLIHPRLKSSRLKNSAVASTSQFKKFSQAFERI